MKTADIDQQLLRQVRQLARKECANCADGLCLPEDGRCHVVLPAYARIHDGAIGCDWFLAAVAPLRPELDAASLSSLPATGRSTVRPAARR